MQNYVFKTLINVHYLFFPFFDHCIDFFLSKRRSRHFNPHYRYSSNLTSPSILIIITQSQISHLTLRTPNINNQNQIATKTQPLTTGHPQTLTQCCQYHIRLHPEDGKSHTVPFPNQLMYFRRENHRACNHRMTRIYAAPPEAAPSAGERAAGRSGVCFVRSPVSTASI